jgi:CO/xanthine dehydrogenase FAD-binding subunit
LFIRPKTVDDALSSLSAHQAQILSGGTDFFPALGDRAVRGTVVDISALRALRGITNNPDHTRIGALTTWTEIVQTRLPLCFDGLKDAAREIGAIQIQNRGTIAGNLCNASPAADGVPPLLALDAAVELASSGGLRRMPLAEFIVGNRRTLRRADELLTAVIVPRTLDDASSSFVKLGVRRYLVISISMVATVVLADGSGRVAAARVAVGSCSAVARRLPQLENDLIGAPIDAELGARVRADHLAPLSPIDDVRATADYRRDASITLIQRALNRCAEKR